MFLKDCMFAHQVRERRWFVSKKSDDDDDVCYYIGERPKLEGETESMGVGTHALLEVRHRCLVGSGRPSMLMLVRSAAALATMRPVLLLRVLKKAARREVTLEWLWLYSVVG